MAEGGGFDPTTFDWDQFYKDNPGILQNDDEEEGNVTNPFTPAEASTPRYRGDEFEMQTKNQEHADMEPSYDETNFGGDERTPLIEKDSVQDIERRLDLLRRNSVTGIIDIRELNPKENILSLEEKNDQIRRAKRFIKSRYPNFN